MRLAQGKPIRWPPVCPHGSDPPTCSRDVVDGYSGVLATSSARLRSPWFSSESARRTANLRMGQSSTAKGPFASIRSRFVVPLPSDEISCVPIMRSPVRRVSHAKRRPRSNSVTTHSTSECAGCLIRATLPIPKGPLPTRFTDVTVEVHSGHRSTSSVTRQTTAGGHRCESNAPRARAYLTRVTGSRAGPSLTLWKGRLPSGKLLVP
jgi:hypothetical protein